MTDTKHSTKQSPDKPGSEPPKEGIESRVTRIEQDFRLGKRLAGILGISALTVLAGLTYLWNDISKLNKAIDTRVC